MQLLEHPRFRAAYDFMCIREQSGDTNEENCDWWTHIQTLSNQEQRKIILSKPKKSRKRKMYHD